MKIGILTLHSQLNYGGVLQCWALKRALERMGHEVCVIDRWIDRNNRLLRGPLAGGVIEWIKFIVKVFLFRVDLCHLLRIRRTMNFVRALGLSEYHFHDWGDAPKELGLDLIVVGSDQVWNPGFKFTKAYLMTDVKGVSRISYAASFGCVRLPDNLQDYYKRALAKFTSVSCRESEGVKICSDLGVVAKHVVDPTLLLNREDWMEFTGKGRVKYKKLVCYFMDARCLDALPSIRRFARKMRCQVEIFQNSPIKHKKFLFDRRIRFCFGSGPVEFVQSFAAAEWVITDSFHAVMFASIFSCNLRFVRPLDFGRGVMFARIGEFGEAFIKGKWLSDDVSKALMSLEEDAPVVFDYDKIQVWRNNSHGWLKNAIDGVRHAQPNI